MKNPFVRWLVWIGGAFVALVFLAAGVVFFLVSRLDVGAEIERVVERATGRDLTIAGDVGVSFYPVLGLRAEQAALANVEGGRALALASIERLDVGVEIAPLFRREVVVRDIVLQQPRIFLEVDAEGKPNWLLQPAAAPAPSPTPGPAPETPFSLAGVRTIDGEAHYFDARANVDLALSEVNMRSALESLDAPLRVRGSLVYGGERVGVDAEIGALRAVMAGRGTTLKATLDGPLLEADFEGETTAAAGEIGGAISASGPSLRRLAAWLGAPISGGYGMENFSVAGHLTAGAGRLSFANATFTLDALNGRGDFELTELRGKPYVSGRIELFAADFNPYISGAAPAAAAETGTAAPASAESAPDADEPARGLDVHAAPSEQAIDFSGLRAINCDLEITAHEMTVQRMKIDGALLTLVLNEGYMAATLHRLDLYGGTGRGRLEVDGRESAVRIVQDMSFDGVDALSFLTDAANLANIEGRAELSINLRTGGRTQAELIAAADGQAHIEVVSGALRGVDLGGVSRTIGNALSGDLVRPSARTPFHGFSATFALADGVLASESLSFNTPQLVIRGLGLFDIGAQRMEVRLAPRSVGVGIVTPFSVRGPLSDLSYDSDFRDRVLRDLQPRVRAVQAAARGN